MSCQGANCGLPSGHSAKCSSRKLPHTCSSRNRATLRITRARVTGGMANMTPYYRASQHALQEDQVEPAVELVTHLAQVAAARKSQALVEADRGGVGGIDAG